MSKHSKDHSGSIITKQGKVALKTGKMPHLTLSKHNSIHKK